MRLRATPDEMVAGTLVGELCISRLNREADGNRDAKPHASADEATRAKVNEALACHVGELVSLSSPPAAA